MNFVSDLTFSGRGFEAAYVQAEGNLTDNIEQVWLTIIQPAGCPMLLDSFINPRKMSEIITRGELARSSAFHAFPLDDLCR